MVVEGQKFNKRLFKASIKPNWCPKCGDYALLSATTKALAKLGYQPNEVVITSGIGCSSSFPHWTTAYGIHMLHGRALPAAAGVKMVNPDLKVIAVGGDGDGYGIGVGHFVHTARRNLAITYMVMNNQIYGLTMGQSSPSSQFGHVTITAPQGVDEQPINAISLSLGAGASFVARGFSGESAHLQGIIEEALNHNGFAFIDVLSPCVTFNRINTYEWFRKRVYKLDRSHDQGDITAAFAKAHEFGDRIPLGIFYKSDRPPLHELDPVTRAKNPVNEPLGFKAQGIDIQAIFDDFR
ncbi:MAG: thiamine pyrophosphate-dependent enzyme [Candidatus Hodarchaeales archaeon]|jgi:2-oxoglutarate ferredoxin oxidoreductase subunit beta